MRWNAISHGRPRQRNMSSSMSKRFTIKAGRFDMTNIISSSSSLSHADEKLMIGKFSLTSRLILGTGKYSTMETMAAALAASGTQMVTVAVGRVNLLNRTEKNILDFIDTNQYVILPNTAGAYTAEDAIRIARLAREAGIGDLVKLEVLGDAKTRSEERRVGK